jgi:transcription elongation factor GreA-like protein
MTILLVSLLASGFQLYAAAPQSLMDQYKQAWELTGQMRADEAIPILKGIIEQDRTFHRAYLTLVHAYRQKKAFDRADEYFRSLLA